MTGKEYKKVRLVDFRWIFLVDTIVIVGAVMSFGMVAVWGLNMGEEESLVMIFVIPPMTLATAVSTYVTVHAIRKRMDRLLDGIQSVGNGDLEVRLDVSDAGEYKIVYENFNRMVTELKSTKEEMQAFVNEFSHEFKTPITSIQGFAQYLADTGKEVESPERMQYLRVIADESMRLAELSQNTLLLSKVEACQIITDKREFDISEQIRHCTILLLPQIEKKNICMELNLSDHMYYYGNAELVEQIWINLLNNAIKFTPEGGEIEICADMEETQLVVSVSDSGVGMDEVTLARIFEKYYQGDNSHRKGGNGIGLSIVHRIVILCNGEISVKSVLGAGSTFSVRLPMEM